MTNEKLKRARDEISEQKRYAISYAAMRQTNEGGYIKRVDVLAILDRIAAEPVAAPAAKPEKAAALKSRLDLLSDRANPGPYGVDSYGSGTTYITLGTWVGHYASDRVPPMGGGRAEIVNSNIPSTWGEANRKGATAHFLAELANAYRQGEVCVYASPPPSAAPTDNTALVEAAQAVLPRRTKRRPCQPCRRGCVMTPKQIQGYANNLKGAINADTTGAEVTVDLTTARAIYAILVAAPTGNLILSGGKVSSAAEDDTLVQPTDNTALVEALEAVKSWHESQDKALSKQPPSNADKWMRLEHQEQIGAIDAALASRDAAPEGDGVDD